MAQGQKHTPGPWVVDSGNGSACYIRPADHEPGVMAVAQVCKRGWSEKQANARLIAAAPDTTAACGRVSEILFNMAVNGGALPTREELEEAYRLTAEAWNKAAIAKAEAV